MRLRDTGTVLDRIVRRKAFRLEADRDRRPLERLRDEAEAAGPVRPFRRALEAGQGAAVIAELKKASPSAGLLRAGLDPAALARAYEAAGAAALSVLTEEDHFLGQPRFLPEARRAASLPVLRKDFLFDPYHLYESRALGADAVLLIERLLSPGRLEHLAGLARSLGMDALVEVHDEAGLAAALGIGADLVGINRRDLARMEVDPSVSDRLLPRVPAGVTAVVESGVRGPEDVERAAALGARAVLVGETLVRAGRPGEALRALRGGVR